MRISEFQQQQKEWAQANFDWEQSWESALQPLVGVSEEIGELAGAETKEEALDAIADIIIYLCDVANRTGLQFLELSFELYELETELKMVTLEQVKKQDTLKQICIYQGRLSHAILKSVQRIRKNEDHRNTAQLALSSLLTYLNHLAKLAYNKDLWVGIVFPVWENIVSKRDWRKENAEG